MRHEGHEARQPVTKPPEKYSQRSPHSHPHPHSAFAFANKHIKFAANLALSSKGGREGGYAGQVKDCRNKSIKCSQCKVRRESARAVAKNYLSGKNLCIMKTVNSKL